MPSLGRLHPLLIHFPIALVIAAAIAEAAAAIAGNDRWRAIAVANIRAGAMFAVVAAIAGWRLASDPGVEMSSVLEWHRWLGTVGAGMALVAALATAGTNRRSSLSVWLYRTALFAAGLLVTVTSHLGGVMVWGANFLRP
jgi:uncharacterized membrane protein